MPIFPKLPRPTLEENIPRLQDNSESLQGA